MRMVKVVISFDHQDRWTYLPTVLIRPWFQFIFPKNIRLMPINIYGIQKMGIYPVPKAWVMFNDDTYYPLSIDTRYLVLQKQE